MHPHSHSSSHFHSQKIPSTSSTSSTSSRSFMSSIISIWNERWFLSTNAKDIGTLYLIFALFSGLLGTAFSVLIRMELSGPGVQYIADNQLYNSIITAHALLMIFFMVKNIRLSKYDSHISNQTGDIIISNGACAACAGNNNNNANNNNNNNNDNKLPRYTKVFIENPFNNRKHILKVSKNQRGVYVWEYLKGDKSGYYRGKWKFTYKV